MATKKLFSFTLTLFLFFFSLNGEKTRDYLTTGGWYPASRATLNSTLNQLMNKAKTTTAPGRIRALIGPHAGLTYSGMCAANGYKQLENLRETERIFILGVSHKGGFYGACVSDFVFNTTPLGKIPVDTTITQKLAKEKYFRINNQIMQHEHSIENHLPFIQKIYKNKKIKIIPILFGQLQKKDFKVLANTIKKYIDEKTLVIASSDFTHYGRNFGYAPFKKNVKHNLTKLDMGMIEKILKNDFNGYVNTKMKTGITMCGFTPVGVLLNIFSGNRYKGKLIDYYKSGDSNNDYSFSVSYASIIIYEKNRETKKTNSPKLSVEEKKTLLSIARHTLKIRLGENKSLENIEKKFNISENLKKKCGVFVTLKIKGHLRGCIGSIIGRHPVYLGVKENVISAALNDPRFKPVKKGELNQITIEISVMTPLKKIDDYKKIRLGVDGLIIKKGYNQAVYLPQVATETGWKLDEFLGHLCQKAGLYSDAYKSRDMDFYIFQALVFKEKEFKNEI